MRNAFRASLLVLGLTFGATPAFAWGEQGHAAVCELAYRNFTPTSRLALIDLFKAWSQRHGMGWRETRNEELLYQRFMNSCIFEDVVRKRNELRAFSDSSGHFVNYARSKATIADNETACPANSTNQPTRCILHVLERDMTRFKDVSADKADRAEGLIGIGHWLGDIHQPLHLSFRDDKGGNDIKVSGACGRSGNLHSVWDTCLLMKGIWEPLRVKRNLRRTSNKRTIAFRIVDDWRASETQPEVKQAVAGWITKTEPWQWAQESYRLTLSGIAGSFTENQYCFKQSGTCSYSETDDRFSSNVSARTVNISPAYIARYSVVVDERLRQAAYRLA